MISTETRTTGLIEMLPECTKRATLRNTASHVKCHVCITAAGSFSKVPERSVMTSLFLHYLTLPLP